MSDGLFPGTPAATPSELRHPLAVGGMSLETDRRTQNQKINGKLFTDREHIEELWT